MSAERSRRGKGLARSSRAEVRNPVLALPSFHALSALDPAVRAGLAALLRDLRQDARKRAGTSWTRHKAFAAAYWATVAVYAGHIARALAMGSSNVMPPAGRADVGSIPTCLTAPIEEGRYCVLSTGHLTAGTAAMLDEWASWPPTDRPIDIAASVYGWFVPTRPIDPVRRTQLPEDLLAVIAFGNRLGCQFVLVDCDGRTVDALPRRPW